MSEEEKQAKESTAANEVVVTKKFLEDLKERLGKQDQEIGVLKAIADKKALAAYHARNKTKLDSIVSVRTMEVFDEDANESRTKVVVGWRTIKNKVYQDAITRAWKEDQTIELYYLDDTKQTIPLLDFFRSYASVECRRIGQIEDKGEITLKVKRLDNDKEFLIGTSFVN